MKLLEDFCNYIMNEKNLSMNTVDGYGRDLSQFTSFIEKPVTKVTTEDVSSFLSHRRAEGDGVSTVSRKLSAIKSFYNFLVRRGKLKYNPASSIEGMKKPKRLPRPVDSEDIDSLLNMIDNLRDRTIFEVLYATGIRREELCAINIQTDINFRRGELRVVGKGDSERIIPLFPRTLDYIKSLSAEHGKEWLFPSIKTGGHIGKRQINEIVNKWTSAAGLEWVTPHKFRHSFATHLMDNGVDLGDIQELLGHSSPETTKIYAGVSKGRARSAVMKHPLATEKGQP
ncbi:MULTISPECIES: tyrosine-type recombinase/integrase [unclassified Paenibacillus]|uniref:tyrosine-type recombinase/integrase n=1 Tax=unclassified Paenibacillus TaxID=185978 RepID=UPI000895011A|nr:MULTISPECIES: tyrosine-type recombinase/integrase [unclassified Paenibacillus]OMC68631.1 hypothetical protein BK126_12445 [Paenibacillus sp. FSL H7-0326]SDW56763.1 integrase/recombinase XerD [Paenibacillus sp. PDC88]